MNVEIFQDTLLMVSLTLIKKEKHCNKKKVINVSVIQRRTVIKSKSLGVSVCKYILSLPEIFLSVIKKTEPAGNRGYKTFTIWIEFFYVLSHQHKIIFHPILLEEIVWRAWRGRKINKNIVKYFYIFTWIQ